MTGRRISAEEAALGILGFDPEPDVARAAERARLGEEAAAAALEHREARRRVRELKSERLEIFAEFGPHDPRGYGDRTDPPCFDPSDLAGSLERSDPAEDGGWCDACLYSAPLYLEISAEARRSRAALGVIRLAGRRIAQLAAGKKLPRASEASSTPPAVQPVAFPRHVDAVIREGAACGPDSGEWRRAHAFVSQAIREQNRGTDSARAIPARARERALSRLLEAAITEADARDRIARFRAGWSECSEISAAHGERCRLARVHDGDGRWEPIPSDEWCDACRKREAEWGEVDRLNGQRKRASRRALDAFRRVRDLDREIGRARGLLEEMTEAATSLDPTPEELEETLFDLARSFVDQLDAAVVTELEEMLEEPDRGES